MIATGTPLFGLGFLFFFERNALSFLSSHVLSPGIRGFQDGKFRFSQISAFSLKPP